MRELHFMWRVVQFLLDNGAQVDAKDHKERTPLHFACNYGLREVASLLLSRNANPFALSKEGCAPVHYVCLSGSVETLQLILNLPGSESDVSVRSRKHHMTPLHMAVYSNRLELMEYLLARGAELEAVNAEGRCGGLVGTSMLSWISADR